MWIILVISLCIYYINGWLTSRIDYIGYISNSECNAGGDYWRGKYFCDYGYFAVGATLYWETNIFGNSGANDFRIYCAPLYNWNTNYSDNNPIPSNSPNDNGNNNDVIFCNNGEFITGFSVKTEYFDCDDEGVTNVKIKCESELKNEYPVSENSGYYGTVTHCPINTYACGQEIKYQNPVNLWPLFNDAGMTGLRILCCRYPPHTKEPTITPTMMPTFTPSLMPTLEPTREPTISTTLYPTQIPTLVPTSTPTILPTPHPTLSGTLVPSITPTMISTSMLLPTYADSLLPTSLPTEISQSTNSNINHQYIMIAIIFIIINICVVILCATYIYCWRSKKIMEKHLQSMEMDVIPSKSHIQTVNSNSSDILTTTLSPRNIISTDSINDEGNSIQTDTIIASEIAQNQLDIHILTKGFIDSESFETKGNNNNNTKKTDTIIAQHLQQNQFDIQSITKGNELVMNTPI